MFSGLFDEDDNFMSADYGNDRAPYPAYRPGLYSKRVPSDKRSPYGFVGLLNQGATCYLNSLIQLMYMTPELKNSLYTLSLKDLDLEQQQQQQQDNIVVNSNATTNTQSTTPSTAANATVDSTSITSSLVNNDTSSNLTTTSSLGNINSSISIGNLNNITTTTNNNSGNHHINNELVSFMNEDEYLLNSVEWEEVGVGVYPPRSNGNTTSDDAYVELTSTSKNTTTTTTTKPSVVTDQQNNKNNNNSNNQNNDICNINSLLSDIDDDNNEVATAAVIDYSDPFSKYDPEYVQTVLAFGFDEAKVLEGLKKYPKIYQQEHLINWILSSDEVIDAQSYEPLPDLIPLGSTANNDDEADFAAFSTMGFEDDNKFHKQNNNSSSNNNQAIVLYDSNNINNFLIPENTDNSNNNNNTNGNENGNGVVEDNKSGTPMGPLLAAAEIAREQQTVSLPKKRRGRVLAYELQRLFSFLQKGEIRAIGTEDLTKSFGWHGSEATEQQDIHELNRILFDAFEHSIKLTNIEKLIVNLYRGVLINRIECTKCGKIKDRDEFYQDIPIPIKGFKKLEDSLQALVTPEVLDGDNAYSCDDCQTKVKAYFGAKLGQLPPILVLPLRRFDFDYNRGSRVKITSQFEFPNEINMTPYTADYSLYEKNPETVPKPDDQNYELFAVLIHSGGAYGGHYHAYIKDITKQGVINIEEPNGASSTQNGKETVIDAHQTSDQSIETVNSNSVNDNSITNTLEEIVNNIPNNNSKKSKKGKVEEKPVYSGWFDFNDSTVTPIPDSHIAKQFGNKHESAYMLIYRSKELKTDKSSDIPLHLVGELETFNINLEEQRQNYDITMNTMFVNPRFFDEFNIVDNVLYEKNNLQPSELVLQLDVGFTVQDLYSHVRKLYEDKIDQTSQLVIQEIIIKEGKVTLQPPLSNVSSINIKKAGVRESCSLLIWKGSKAHGIQTPPIKFSVEFYPKDAYKIENNLSIERDQSFGELLKIISQTVALPVENIAVYRSSNNQLLLLEDDMPLVPLADRIYSGIKLLVEDKTLSFEESALRQEFEMNKYKITLYISDRIDFVDNDRFANASNNKPNSIHCDPKSTISQIKEIILDSLRPTQKDQLLYSTIIRKTQRGGSPGSIISDDSLTLKEVDITDSELIIIERGTPTQQTITIRYLYSVDNNIRTIFFPKKDTILNLKKTILERLDIETNELSNYVLKTTDTFDLPLHIISDEDMTLEESGVRSEDLLVITKGIIPQKDEILLKFAIYQMDTTNYKQYPSPLSPALHLNPQYIPPTADLFSIQTIGELSVNKNQTINELKSILLAWPKLKEMKPTFDEEQDDIRLWLEEKLLTSHGSGNKQISKLHIQQEAYITIEFLKKETLPLDNNPPPILLYVHQRIPDSQCFSCPPKQIYFTGKLISDLVTQISSIYDIEEKHLKLFKYVTHQILNPWRIIEERSAQTINRIPNIKIIDNVKPIVNESTTVENTIDTTTTTINEELPKDEIVQDILNQQTTESTEDATKETTPSTNCPLPPPPPPRPEKKKKPNTNNSNPNELRGKPWLLKDGDMIAFLDIRDDPEENDKFGMVMDKSSYKSNKSSNSGSNDRKSNQVKYRAPERELKIQLDEY